MKALVYQGPGKKPLEERPIPNIEAPTDAVVRITKTTICGTDLHILKGDVPTCAPGGESISRDYEFSRKSIDEYIAEGYAVTAKALGRRPTGV